MLATKPKPILIVTVLLVVLALLSTTSILTSRTGFARPAFNRANGQANNNFANNGGNFPGNNGNGNLQSNPGRNGGNFQGRGGGFNTFTIFRNLGVNPQIIGYVTLGISILGIVLVLFGVGRIGKIAGELGGGIRAFKDGLRGDDDEEKKEEQDNKPGE